MNLENIKKNIEAKEIRQLADNINVNNNNEDSRLIEGYALLFNVLSQDLGGFREKIDPKALDGVLENSDVFALFNHQQDKVLARFCNGIGSLSLTVDEKGLKYGFESPKTELGNEVLEGVKRLDIRNSSFAFVVELDEWQQQPDGIYIRTILKFKEICDVSPVYKPAYQDTTVASRSLNQVKESNDLKEIELKKYYSKYDEQINKIKNNK